MDADQMSQAKQKALEALEIGGGHQQAADAAGASRMTLWRWRREDREFCAAWQQAEDTGCDVLEDVLRACALKAESNPKYQTSLIFTLKNRRPARWNHRQDVHLSGGLDGGPKLNMEAMTDEQLNDILRACNTAYEVSAAEAAAIGSPAGPDAEAAKAVTDVTQ